MTSTNVAPDSASAVSAANTPPSTNIPPSNLYGKIPEILEVPNLIGLQIKSFNWFLETGLRELLDEMIWRSTPLGKFMNSINKRTKISFSSDQLTTKKVLRAWVVRIPTSFVFWVIKQVVFKQL